MSGLPKLEVCFYFFLWISGVSIALYRLFLVGQVFDHRDHDQYHYEDFKNGWKFLNGRFQDQADYEWKTWTSLAIKLTPFLLINLIGAEIIRFRRAFQYLPLWYICITTSFLFCHFGPFLIICYAAVHYLRLEYWLVEKEDDQYLIMVSSSWMILRCISYSSDRINEVCGKKRQTLKTSDILVFLAYSFYLPTMFWGPFISFNYFLEGIQISSCKWTLGRACSIALSFFRCLFWFSFTLFALHFIYVNAILLRPNFVKHLLDWELAGLGIAMGHFFHLKYMVFYGIPCAWAAAEGFTTPKLPCCVSRIHLYSYMWRKFDHGFYQFLFGNFDFVETIPKISMLSDLKAKRLALKATLKMTVAIISGICNSRFFTMPINFTEHSVQYIYVPTITKLKGKDFMRKTAASMLCFAFVFAWHGQHDYVFFWVLFNFIAITIELAVKQIYALPTTRTFMERNFSPRNKIRLECFLAAPLHCFSMISNYFFIGNGVDIGFIYFKRVIYGPAQSKLLVLLFLYGAGQSAVASQKWEKRREEKGNAHKVNF